MRVSYNGLWETQKDMNKNDLSEKVGITPVRISTMVREEFVLLNVLYRIGKTLDVDFEDIVSTRLRNRGEEYE